MGWPRASWPASSNARRLRRGAGAYAKARLTLEEMGSSVVASSTSLDSCGVEMLAGDPAAAERELWRDYEALSAMGERYLLSTLAAELARAVDAQGRLDEALELTDMAKDLSAEDDITSQALWRLIRGKVLARRGQTDEAMQLADEAVALLRQTDASVVRDEGLLDAAEVMRLSGDPVRAREHLAEALELFERKGNLAAAGTARSALAHVGGSMPRPTPRRRSNRSTRTRPEPATKGGVADRSARSLDAGTYARPLRAERLAPPIPAKGIS